MSIDALSWAFNLELPSSGVKLTLLALANYANECDEAYPSQKAISKKTCLCERAIRTHLVTLEELGLITRKSRKRANGSFTSDLFQIHIGATPSSGNKCQRQNLPAAESSKIQRQNLQNPAAESARPDPSLTTTITKDESIRDFLAGVDPQIAKDFLLIRKKKNAVLTETAIEGIRREVTKAGLTLEEALRICCEHNWAGFRADWLEKVKPKSSAKFDALAYVNRNRPNGGNGHEIVIESEKRN